MIHRNEITPIECIEAARWYFISLQIDLMQRVKSLNLENYVHMEDINGNNFLNAAAFTNTL